MSEPPVPTGVSDVDARALSHIDEHGRAHMVDVSSKPSTRRVAVARCTVVTAADAVQVLAERRDGLDVVEASRFAGIQAAKQTSSLVPLCHGIRMDRVRVDVTVGVHTVEIVAVTEIVERTGVEIEALTACAVCALTLLEPLLDVDPLASIENLAVWHKSGGRSGTWERAGDSESLRPLRSPGCKETPSICG